MKFQIKGDKFRKVIKEDQELFQNNDHAVKDLSLQVDIVGISHCDKVNRALKNTLS